MENTSVLFNKETGQAEAVPDEFAQHFLSNETHELPLNDPEGNPVSASVKDVQKLLSQGYSQPSNDQLKSLLNQSKYSSTSEQVKTGLEGLAQGVAGPLATMAETKVLGVKPEDIRGREETNPGIHLGTEAAGFIAPAVATLGTSGAARLGVGAASKALPLVETAAKYSLPGLLEQAGVGAAKVASKAGFVNQIGQDAIKGAFELGLYSGGDEVSKYFKEEPGQTATSAMANVGLSAILGGVAGPIFGSIGRKLGGKQPAEQAFVSQLDRAGVESGDFAATINNAPNMSDTEKKGILAGLSEQKPNAPEIISAAERLGAPVMEGMTSNSKLVQRAEDSLINGAPTFSALKRQALYNEGYQKATQAVEGVLGEGSLMSKAELGNNLKSSITKQFEDQNAPIAALYEQLRAAHDVIPMAENSAKSIADELKQMKEFRLSPSSPEGSLANRVIKEAENIKTVDDLKTYKSMLMRSVSPTASSGERRMAGVIADKLTQLEENSIEDFAMKMAGTPEQKANVLNLIEQRKVANGFYKELIGKVQTISEQLGKGRVYGVQDAINFINDLTPEQITQKLFSKNNSEFLNYFAKEFPEQMQLMRQYQKGILKESAMKGEDFSLKTLFNKVNKFEPEIQKSIFSAEELAKIKDAETYIRAFPKEFNPSGTSHGIAMREFFEKPTGAMLSNLKDAAIEKFITMFGGNPEVSGANALGKATVNGYKEITRAVKSVMNQDKLMSTGLMAVSLSSREKLKDLVDELTANPEKLLDIGQNIAVPEYSAAFAQTAARAVQYLSSLKPPVDPLRPLDSKQVPSKAQEARYNRALTIAERPVTVLNLIKNGALTPDDVATIKNVHPDMYAMLSQKLSDEILNATAKGKKIPYSMRMSLSLFLGQDLDSTMTPQSILSNQPQQAPMPQGAGGPGAVGTPKKTKGSMMALSKIPGMYQTPGQARQAKKLMR